MNYSVLQSLTQVFLRVNLILDMLTDLLGIMLVRFGPFNRNVQQNHLVALEIEIN